MSDQKTPERDEGRLKNCRVCGAALGQPAYSAPPPSVALTTLVDRPTVTYVCDQCSHGQSDDLGDATAYYDTGYRISLQSDDYDQLYEVRPNKLVYRTAYQSELFLSHVAPSHGMRVLDYGAAKAMSLKKAVAARPDLSPHVFDISADYLEFWNKWLPADQCATYTLPDVWSGFFDVVSSYFVLEHISDPLAALKSMRAQLKPGGKLFFIVPNPMANPGDLLVSDHMNHFTELSLLQLLGRAGFGAATIDTQDFSGAFVVTAVAGAPPGSTHNDVATTKRRLIELCDSWATTRKGLIAEAKRYRDRPSAVYGAGFYGSFIMSCIGADIDMRCFVDRNPHLRSQPHLGLPVMAPEALPGDVSVVYAGLNPLRARSILSDMPEWRDRSIQIVYLQDKEFRAGQ